MRVLSALACTLGAAVLLAGPAASAQVNSDVSLSAGAMKRFTTSAASGVSEPGFGPVVEARGHLALLPLIRIGLYATYDHSPMSSGGDRNFVTGGLHLKVTPPLLPAPWKLYVYTGFGGGWTEADGYRTTVDVPPVNVGNTQLPAGRANVTVPQLQGWLLEVPLGIGVARKLGPALELFAELGGRFGVAFFGPMYDSGSTPAYVPTAALPSGAILAPAHAPFAGQDSFALSLSVGVSLSN
jgi:hypothetical protein